MFNHETEEANEVDQESLDVGEHRLYRSHTKIEAIPRGVRIITDILQEENEDSKEHEDESACPKRRTQTDDKWLNKKIDVTVVEDEEDDEANWESLNSYGNL